MWYNVLKSLVARVVTHSLEKLFLVELLSYSLMIIFFHFFPFIRARSRIQSYLNKEWNSSSTESQSMHSVSGLTLHCTIVKVTASLNITLQASLDSTWVPALLLISPPFMFQVFPCKHSLNTVPWMKNTILTRWPAVESWLHLPVVWQCKLLNLPVP